MPTLGSHIASTSAPSTMANTMESHGAVSTGNHGVIGNCGKSRAPSQSGADASIVRRQATSSVARSQASRGGTP